MTTTLPLTETRVTAVGVGLTWPVLVVDDDPTVLTITRHLLAPVRVDGRPLDLVLCSSAAAARVQLREREFALAIFDVAMETPRAGVELIQELRSDPRHCALEVVVRSGEPLAEIGHPLLNDLKVAEFWSKDSVPPDQLRARVMVLLASRLTGGRLVTAEVPEPDGQQGTRNGPVTVQMIAGRIARLRKRLPAELRRIVRVSFSARTLALVSKLRRFMAELPIRAWPRPMTAGKQLHKLYLA